MWPNGNPLEGWEINWEPKLRRVTMGFHILGLDASPCSYRDSLCITSAVFPKLEHFIMMKSML
jgi:hypothetical protein